MGVYNRNGLQRVCSCKNSTILKQEITHVVAIVVTYHPDLPRLLQQLEVLAGQVQDIVLVDNASDHDLEDWAHGLVDLHPAVILLDENHGIAHAQNVGIQWAKSRNASHVLLMDQDSIPAGDMVANLVAATAASPTVAAVGPRYLDNRQNAKSPFVRLSGMRLRRLDCAENQITMEVDCLIASGCLIPMAVLDQVGGMQEDLFIDYVDTEWCLRARHHGFVCYGVCSASMTHSLGETPFFFMGRAFPVHSPLRHYYQVRNAILLMRKAWVPFNWKLALGWHLVLKVAFYSFIMPPRLQHIGRMATGIWHGLTGRGGVAARTE